MNVLLALDGAAFFRIALGVPGFPDEAGVDGVLERRAGGRSLLVVSGVGLLVPGPPRESGGSVVAVVGVATGSAALSSDAAQGLREVLRGGNGLKVSAAGEVPSLVTPGCVKSETRGVEFLERQRTIKLRNRRTFWKQRCGNDDMISCT